MRSYFFEGKLCVSCVECKRKDIDCPFPLISALVETTQKEEITCSQGEPNEALKIEIAKMNYQISKVKAVQNVR